uniref:Uncharacterized protein n=1 Tax=Plectus sambesii TaxID=2011161 RepID=A0A914XGV8_9BILA
MNPELLIVGIFCLLVFVPLGQSVRVNLPEFNDPLLGQLIVSQKKFPFLTLKQDPDLAHVFPTDTQINEIKKAVGGQGNFNRLRAKRQSGGEIDIPDPSFGFDWFEKFQKFLGKFLKFEFSYEILNSTIVDHGSLPFDRIKQDAYFKAMVIEKDMYQPYLEKEFSPRMRNLTAGEKPWLPAEKLIQEMKECLYFKYGSASDEDFQYDKETGGTMVYYKVTCMKLNDMYYVGISTYDNTFTLHDIERLEKIQKGWSLLGFKRHKEEIRRWFEKRYVTLDDLKKLLDYIMRNFAARIRLEYQQYLEASNAPENQGR